MFVSHSILNMFHCKRNKFYFSPMLTLDGLIIFSFFLPGAEDIHGGSLKLILGMVWRLILRYQIGRGKTPPKKLMLAWINAVVPDYPISNFSTDWNDGIALQYVSTLLFNICYQTLKSDDEWAKKVRLYVIVRVMKHPRWGSWKLVQLEWMKHELNF